MLVFSSVSARAQDGYPRAEVFGGYSYIAVGLNEDNFEVMNFHGWAAGISGNYKRWGGVAADVTGGYRRDIQAYTYLFGPRFFARGDKATAFGHFMLGGVTAGESGEYGTDAALAAGGGVDVSATKKLALRFQVDYVPIFPGGGPVHNVRVMSGLVFKFGGD
jgi:hypothetical protein